MSLVGVWEARGYRCADGEEPVQSVVVRDEDGELVAVKITGDSCVPGGRVTFRGARALLRPGEALPVVVTVGNAEEPACCTVEGRLVVDRPGRFVLTAGSGERIEFSWAPP